MHVALERDGAVARVVLNRPEKLNALTAAMLDELRATWTSLAEDPSLRCVIVTGAGRGFCAGADAELLAGDRADARTTAAEELSFLPGAGLAVPVIVAVNGVCAGGGLHFIADADVAVASVSATFIDPHVSVGQVAALEPLTLFLRMRPDVLRRLVLLGQRGRLDAAQALESGLVSEVVPDELLGERAHELAAAICAGSPTAVARSRAVLRDFEAALLDEHLERGWQAIREHWDHPDATEGPTAFLERRPPRWAES